MNVSPRVYSKSNDVQRRDNKFIYETYSHLIHWRPDGNDTVLDIGSGSGASTVDFILPILPKSFKYLMGADIAQDMVDYANKFHSNPKISFVQWNMAGDVKDLLEKFHQGFDHIFSSFTMHWEEDQQQIFKNVHTLLTHGGDCLLTILAKHSVFDVYLELSKMPKWQPFVKTAVHVTPFYQYKVNCVDLCRGILNSAKFRKHKVELLNRTFIYNNLKEIKKFIMSINPFTKSMSLAQKDDFLLDSIEAMLKLGIAERTVDGKDVRYTAIYDLLIVYAQK